MTTQEMINRLRPILTTGFVKTGYLDKSSTVGGAKQRRRVTIFSISNMKLLDEYITYCNEEKEKI